ncbi:MAG TPA: hypothetical protein VEW28_10760 [Candidatus Kapabacteria bacterium]|nr:hypothetical protein [Candidatus Kapabacteria bacterium]
MAEYTPEQIMAFAALAALVVTSLSVLATILLVLITRSALANSNRSLKFAQKTFALTNRPYVVVIGVNFSGDTAIKDNTYYMPIDVQLHNAGNQIAEIINIEIDVKLSNEEEKAYFPDYQINTVVLPRNDQPSIIRFTLLLEKQFIDVMNGRLPLQVKVRGRYRFSRGKKYILKYECEYNSTIRSFIMLREQNADSPGSRQNPST